MPFSSRERFGVPDHESWNNTPSVTVDQVTIFLLLSTGCTEPLLGGAFGNCHSFFNLGFLGEASGYVVRCSQPICISQNLLFSYGTYNWIQLFVLNADPNPDPGPNFAKLIAEKISKRCFAGSLCNNFENLRVD